MGALIGLVFMLLFGIGFAILVGNVLIDNEAPPAVFVVFILFMLAWLAAVLFSLVYHVLNLNRAKGLSLIDVETEPGTSALLPPPLGGQADQSDPMQRLRSLEALKHDGLISEDEFRCKREEIIQQKW
jgi:hypothetical protein